LHITTAVNSTFKLVKNEIKKAMQQDKMKESCTGPTGIMLTSNCNWFLVREC